MQKVKVEAREVLADIHAGMADAGLMEKYKLSSLGLKSLFRKLGEMGLVRQLDAGEVLRDVESGISGGDLIRKYKLSEKALRNLILEINGAALSTHTSQTDDSDGTDSFRNAEIAEAVTSGMSRAEIREKFSLSERGLKWICSVLISEGILSWQEVYENICTNYQQLVPERTRRHPRYKARYPLPIREAASSEVVGSVRDLSKGGVGIQGIEAKVGQIKTPVVPGDYFGEFAAFTFDAKCRWVHQDSKGECIAGFEIIYISTRDMVEFEILLKLLRFSHR